MGPVITPESKARILRLVDQGLGDGGKLLLDGRDQLGSAKETSSANDPHGHRPANPLNSTEIFGPVLTLNRVETLDEAIEALSLSAYGNSSAIFLERCCSAQIPL